MSKNKEITHRCEQLLTHNKDYKNGDKIRIFYGFQYDNPYNEKNGAVKGWWLEHLTFDSEDWDFRYMSSVCRIDYCPCCGKKLEF